MCMRIDDCMMRRIVSDLGLTTQFVKGQDIPVKNCWHFCSDGNAVDVIFRDDGDFVDGMNRIYLTVREFHAVVILAFILMDTHIHFILYGRFDECNKFVHEYLRRTSAYISKKYGERKKFGELPIGFQEITDDRYLKTAICYVFRNAPVGGLNSTFYDYPWSSCALEFRRPGLWTSPVWTEETLSAGVISDIGCRSQRNLLKTRMPCKENYRMMGGMIFPGEYVAYELVERIFRTHRTFFYFMGSSKETDIESRGGAISYLTLPMQEMRQHRNELCIIMFGRSDLRNLDTAKRISLARALKSRYNSSVKQIARLCGLQYKEIENLI